MQPQTGSHGSIRKKKPMMSQNSIIPKPNHFQSQNGFFQVTDETVIHHDLSNQWNAGYLQNLLNPPTGFNLKARKDNSGSQNAILLYLGPRLPGKSEEGYRLSVDPERVTITAGTSRGVFYGIQTLRQLLPNEIERQEHAPGIQWQIPSCEIDDQPRFSWRGFMFKLIFSQLHPDFTQNILGIEATLWTEWVPSQHRLDYQAFPRLTAFAETGWTFKKNKVYPDFHKRMTSFAQRLEIHKVLYAPEHIWDPPWYKRAFELFTIIQPQTQTAGAKSK